MICDEILNTEDTADGFVGQFRLSSQKVVKKTTRRVRNSLGKYLHYTRKQISQGKTMASLNKAMIIGNLGADPEVRYTQSNTAIANFNVATSEKYKDSNGDMKETTEWHKIVCWGRLAEIAQQYLRKGNPVYIEGTIQTRQWEDKEGQKRYVTEIKALALQLLSSRQDAGSEMSQSSGYQRSAPTAAPASKSGVVVNDDFNDMDDDLPF